MAVLTEMIASSEGDRTPLLLEVPVSRALDGPFLVSSTKGFIWVADKFPNGHIRAAVRKVPWGFLFREAIVMVAAMSEKRQWGNFQPPTPEGVRSAIGHLIEYDVPAPLEVLYGANFDLSILEGGKKLLPEGIPRYEETWVPEGWAVVVPEDRSFVGTTVDFGEGQRACVIHNASRGLSIIAPSLPTPSEE